MKATLFVFTAFLCNYTSAQSAKTLLQKPTQPTPGVSAERFKRIDQNLQGWVDEKKINGCVGL
jgi:hypothetical protein